MVKEQLSELLINKFGKPDVIAGVATGAIGIGMLVADFLNLPFIYVRPEAKKHGRKNQIEGKINSSQKVVVIEDLISTGLLAVESLKEAKINVKGMLAIFTYGFAIAEENFKNANVNLHTLSNYYNLLLLAEKSKYITSSEAEILSKWRIDPGNWGK